MVQIKPISSPITLRALQQDLGLAKSNHADDFLEWQTHLPELTELEQATLGHIRQNFTYQLEWGQRNGSLSPFQTTLFKRPELGASEREERIDLDV
jgi:hypothetical protein